MTVRDEMIKLELSTIIRRLTEENERLRQENASYKLWMDRSIDRLKEMQDCE